MMFKNFFPSQRRNDKSRHVLQSIMIFIVINVCTYSPVSFSQKTKPLDAITPSAIIDVVYIQPFSLDEAYVHHWREEKPLVRSGVLAVFKVAPELVYPRNTAEPILYVGSQTAEQLNSGHESGYVVAIIPGASHLGGARAWFGSPRLPERVNKKIIEMEMAIADKERIQTLDSRRVARVTQKRLSTPNLATLLSDHASELVIKFSPSEKSLTEAWRLPVVKR